MSTVAKNATVADVLAQATPQSTAAEPVVELADATRDAFFNRVPDTKKPARTPVRVKGVGKVWAAAGTLSQRLEAERLANEEGAPSLSALLVVLCTYNTAGIPVFGLDTDGKLDEAVVVDDAKRVDALLWSVIGGVVRAVQALNYIQMEVLKGNS